MSLIETAQLCEERSLSTSCQTTELVISPKEKSLGEFSVRRFLPIAKRRQIGPFVFFDHMGPADIPPHLPLNVRSHPHIGLATVTYLFSGSILHKDSLGTEQVIEPGAVNLMVAGHGIVHAEKTPEHLIDSGQYLNGLQIWLGLPIEHEATDPEFHHYPKQDIPMFEEEGMEARVIMGTAHDLQSPVKTFSPTLYVEYTLSANAKVTLPQAQERGLYVVEGKVNVGHEQISSFEMAVLNPLDHIEVTAMEESKIVLIGGASLGKRHMFWNFVASKPELIEQAKKKWNSGAFSMVPGETDFIPMP